MNQIGLYLLSSFLELWPILRVLNILGAMGQIALGSMIGFARKGKIKDASEQDEPIPGRRLLTQAELEEEEKLMKEGIMEEVQDDSVAFITHGKAKEE